MEDFLYRETAPVLEMEGITKSFDYRKNLFGKKEDFKVLDNFSLSVERGESVALLGDSGRGKSTIAKCIVGIEKPDAGRVKADSELVFEKTGERVVDRYDDLAFKKKVQIIMQDPYSSLNPRKTVGRALVDVLVLHRKEIAKEEREKIAKDYMERCELERNLFSRYPHELSGGQRQRVGIARALCVEPKLLVCDEITSSLDLIVQAHILNLLLDLKEEKQLSYLFISHDRDVLKCFCDRMVML